MCGITGLIKLNGDVVSFDVLKQMTNAIAHRGPDGEGQWIEDYIGIGHRRLAIIDPSPAGHQPMISYDSRWILSYNGEIYNFQELRIELEAEGVFFKSKTDSEVVLYALAKWGTKALLRFNGMFALALWDRDKKTLLLARDRYGIKPIYYTQQDSFFSFSSEQKAILSLPDFKLKLNKPALLEYFTFQNIFTDQTLSCGIHLLQPGHFLKFDLSQSKINIFKYWDYSFKDPDSFVSSEEYIEELDRLFAQAVKRQLVSDVDLGTYLSGGIDSGSITAVAAMQINNLKSFTCGFDLSSASGIELSFDERVKAEAMSALFNTEHYQMVLKAGDMERCLPQLAWHLEEPRVGQSYPNYYAAQLASKFVKVVLSGSGGDELFAGYPWRYFAAQPGQTFDQYIDKYYSYWKRLLSNSELKILLKPIWKDVNHVWTKDIFKNIFPDNETCPSKPEEFINLSLYFEAKSFLHGLLVVEDKLSMAHSLENRVVFLDNDLVDFAMRCPIHLKLNNLKRKFRIDENVQYGKEQQYFKKTNDGKLILRKMASKYIPNNIVQSKKQGFSSPDASWFRGKSIDFVTNICKNKQSPIFEFIDFNATQSLISEHINGKSNRRLLIWSILNFNEYLKHFH
tara:strand:+ start:5376 stop:7247 length:1872 start_codon:yes stop_codon:yes gene_type:complete